MTTTPARMQQRRRTEAQWASENPVLAAGEIGIATGGVAPRIKIGDGVTAWNSLTKIMLPEIETGVFSGTGPEFGATWHGIEREGRVFPAGEMCSPTAVMNFGDGFPRLNMPAGDTTHVYMIFECEEWWLRSTIGVYFEWANDHTATGDVRWDCDIKQCNIGSALSTAVTLTSRTFTIGGVGANGGTTTSIVGSVANGNPVQLFSPGPGGFASFYRLRITRLGADAADTLAGPVGLIAASMTRGQ